MKKCYKCGLDKSCDSFSKNKSRPDGLNNQCKECHTLYKKQHYIDNKESYIENSKKSKEKFKNWFLTEVKEKLVCNICGEDRHWVLDFHHRNPSEKESSVSSLLSSMNKNKVLAEITKCDVLCANCHRDFHYHEK